MERPVERRVCVIDDDQAVRDSMRAMLESFGLEVSDYSSASDFLARLYVRPGGCLLIDLHMPGMSGLELLELLRARGWNSPAILITGRGDDALRQRAMRAGALALLDKPVDESELLEMLARGFSCGVASIRLRAHEPE